MKTNETIEEFTERMSKVEFKKQYQVGRAYQGDTREVYEYEGQMCLLECRGYRTAPKNGTVTPAMMYYVACSDPSDYWDHCQLIYGKERANKIAKYYGAKNIDEAPYAQEEGKWFSILFNEFEDLMKMVYDIHTGKWLELWGKEAKEYVNCF